MTKRRALVAATEVLLLRPPLLRRPLGLRWGCCRRESWPFTRSTVLNLKLLLAAYFFYPPPFILVLSLIHEKSARFFLGFCFTTDGLLCQHALSHVYLLTHMLCACVYPSCQQHTHTRTPTVSRERSNQKARKMFPRFYNFVREKQFILLSVKNIRLWYF